MSKINDGGPAFPTTKPLEHWGDPNQGMTLRDWFAGQALSNPAICKHGDEWPQKTAYCFADAMLDAAPVNSSVGEEPFAWAYRWRDDEPWSLQFGKPSAPGVVGKPLYTTPRPSSELVAALRGMLNHSCVADSSAEDKDAEDHDAERAARAAIRNFEALTTEGQTTVAISSQASRPSSPASDRPA